MISALGIIVAIVYVGVFIFVMIVGIVAVFRSGNWLGLISNLLRIISIPPIYIGGFIALFSIPVFILILISGQSIPGDIAIVAGLGWLAAMVGAILVWLSDWIEGIH